MRSFGFLLVGALAGCGVEQGQPGLAGQVTDRAAQSASETGQGAQRSQYADATIVTELQLQSAGMSVLVTGQAFPVTIQIFYSGDKTTDTGRTIAAPVLKHTVSLNPDETKQVTINLADPAFAGNYGTIFLNS